jgi:hypothetical protein
LSLIEVPPFVVVIFHICPLGSTQFTGDAILNTVLERTLY